MSLSQRKGKSIDRGLTVGEDFAALPHIPVDFLTDTARLNRKLNARRDNPYRWKIGTFTLPVCSEVMHRKLVIDACEDFVETMTKQWWTLSSRLAVSGPYPGKDLDTGMPLSLGGKTEFRVKAIFKMEKFSESRLEIPKDMVKQDPEHVVSLREALTIG